MKKEKIFTREFVVICICLFAGSYVVYGLNSGVPLYVNAVGGTTGMSGILNTGFTVCACVFRLLGGHLCDRVGRRRIMLLGAGIFTAATAVYSLMTSFVPLLIFRSIQGMGYALMSIGASTALVDILPEERYGEGLGYSNLANTLAGSTAPSIVIWLLTDFDFTTMFLVTAAVTLCGGLATLLFCRYERDPAYLEERQAVLEKKAEERQRSRVEKSFAERTVWVILEKQAFLPCLVSIAQGIGTAIVYIYMTLYAVDAGIPRPGLFFTASSISMVFARIIGGRLADRENAMPCIVLGYVLMLLSLGAQIFTQNPWIYYLSGVLFGVASGFIAPVLNRLAIIGVDADRRGAASATYSISADLGMCIGGIVWGFVIESFGYNVGFRCVTGWLVLAFAMAVAYILYIQRKRKKT